jgi:hypothetical protein
MSGFVMDEGQGFHRFGIVQGGGDRAFLVAHFATVLVAMEKDVLGADVAEDIDTGITSNLFGAVAPEDDLLLQVENAYADLQAVEDVAVSIGVAKGRHGVTGILLACSSAENGFGFKRGGESDFVSLEPGKEGGFAKAWGWHLRDT